MSDSGDPQSPIDSQSGSEVDVEDHAEQKSDDEHSSDTGSSIPQPKDKLEFRSPFEFQERLPLTLVELRMRRFSGKIRQKPRWWEKVQDDALVEKWRKEMITEDWKLVESLWGGKERFREGRPGHEKRWPRDPIGPGQLDYIFEELRHDAQAIDMDTGIYPAAIPLVYESQLLIPSELRDALLKGVSALESVPDDEKDWHPGSDGQVLDLVHPSLYPLCIGRTVVVDAPGGVGPHGHTRLHTITNDEYMRRPDIQRYEGQLWALSEDFQWLPTDFSVSSEGQVMPLGYINNLHPLEDRELYSTISAILERFVPMFERTIYQPLPERIVVPDPWNWYRHIPQSDPRYKDQDRRRDEEWWDLMSWPAIPDPPPFTPPAEGPTVNLELSGRTIQVIVKLANIILTPEKPSYSGGSWHVEGMSNERIIATGLYYYACDNISESRLSFRATVGTEDPYSANFHDQWDNRGCLVAYGFGEHSSLNQALGDIVAYEGKCVAFPNEYQHAVEPFELVDPTRPGYRKILCFFLVDPLYRVHSTSDVPPQQAEWWDHRLIGGLFPKLFPAFSRLPPELQEQILDELRAGTTSRAQAEEDRRKLMDERSDFPGYHDEVVFARDFNMCEH
ncbi:hypothetical protein C8Q70DRAFT_1056268 [Cubamyces menziesii]|uniref:Uncharacterized protein n=1 Tax=Trametes cubensis TaxID=1111947 RepID=A0AAD7U2H6_9APHY|nr:hypothetical protein C8Q70DRAFT_1056268 [Cubamyces menziesii]KAJ8495761.1 hypothetical protein ONZ51_g1548 [Trametes cubensis]